MYVILHVFNQEHSYSKCSDRSFSQKAFLRTGRNSCITNVSMCVVIVIYKWLIRSCKEFIGVFNFSDIPSACSFAEEIKSSTEPFVQDFARILREINIPLECPVRPTRVTLNRQTLDLTDVPDVAAIFVNVSLKLLKVRFVFTFKQIVFVVLLFSHVFLSLLVPTILLITMIKY